MNLGNATKLRRELGEAGRQTNCRDIFFAFFQNRTTHSKELITPEKDKHKLMTG